MLALLNQFSFTQVAIGGLVIVGLNTVMLRWAMSRLQADPRNDIDPADRDAEILGDERARSSVATPRPRRLQSSAAGGGKTLAEAGLGAAETVVPAEMTPVGERAGALRAPLEEAAPPLPGGAFAKAQLNVPGKTTVSLTSRPGGIKPPAKPEPVAAKAGSDLISIDKPVSSLPTVSSGQIAPSFPAKPAETLASGKPDFGLIEPPAKSDEPDDVKKTKTIKSSAAAPAAVASGLTVIPPLASVESKPEAKKPAAVEAKVAPIETKKSDAKKSEAKKVEPLPAAPKEVIPAVVPAPVVSEPAPAPVPVPVAAKPEVAPPPPPAAEPEAATVAPAAEAPAKSFWRPRIFLPTKLAPKAAEPVEAKAAVEPSEPAPVEAVPVAEKVAEEAAAAAAAVTAVKVAVDESAKAPAAKVETPVSVEPVVAEKPAEIVSEPVVAEKPAEVISEPVVAEKPAEIISEPVVAEKPAEVISEPVVAEKPAEVISEPVVAEKPAEVVSEPVVAEKPAPEPAPIVPILPATPPAPAAEPIPAPAASLIPAASHVASSTTTKPVMSTETTANRASAQLTLSFEITSLQLTPFFKLGGVQIRPLSNVVSLHLISAQASDSPMAAGISFEIDKVELDDQSNLRSLLLKPLGQAQAASTPQSKLQVDAVQITQGGEGSIQVTSAQSASTAVQLISLLTIASMEFTPSFEIGSLRLEPNSKSVQLRLAPSQRPGALDLPPSFDITSIQLGNEAQFSLLSLTPSAK